MLKELKSDLETDILLTTAALKYHVTALGSNLVFAL